MPSCRLSFNNAVTGFKMDGKVTRNNCPCGSPRLRTTLHPSNWHVRLMPESPNESRTTRRVCACACDAHSGIRKSTNPITTPHRIHLHFPQPSIAFIFTFSTSGEHLSLPHSQVTSRVMLITPVRSQQ